MKWSQFQRDLTWHSRRWSATEVIEHGKSMVTFVWQYFQVALPRDEFGGWGQWLEFREVSMEEEVRGREAFRKWHWQNPRMDWIGDMWPEVLFRRCGLQRKSV